ncbi:hypothetical protein [Aquimarina agarilytica]|uniref:hypothetical protein n=1 Tax=Aquimarina agarilytica TaxID=1087449 RepID=UPI00028901F8|nr:hypothetical protein [Aquimarina agarilytica]
MKVKIKSIVYWGLCLFFTISCSKEELNQDQEIDQNLEIVNSDLKVYNLVVNGSNCPEIDIPDTPIRFDGDVLMYSIIGDMPSSVFWSVQGKGMSIVGSRNNRTLSVRYTLGFKEGKIRLNVPNPNNCLIEFDVKSVGSSGVKCNPDLDNGQGSYRRSVKVTRTSRTMIGLSFCYDNPIGANKITFGPDNGPCASSGGVNLLTGSSFSYRVVNKVPTNANFIIKRDGPTTVSIASRTRRPISVGLEITIGGSKKTFHIRSRHCDEEYLE